MITIKPVEEKEIKKVLDKYDEILAENLDIFKAENSMIVAERDQILGISSYIANEDTGIIKVLFIDETNRRMNLGDGLIKSTLNLMDHRGIAVAYIGLNKEFEPFLASASLVKVEDDAEIEMLKEMMGSNDVVIYKAILPDYFNTSCKSSKKQ